MDNRMRYPLSVVHAVRKAVGPDFTILVKVPLLREFVFCFPEWMYVCIDALCVCMDVCMYVCIDALCV